MIIVYQHLINLLENFCVQIVLRHVTGIAFSLTM